MSGPETAQLMLEDATYSWNSENLKESQYIISYLTLSLIFKKISKNHPSFLRIRLMRQENIN